MTIQSDFVSLMQQQSIEACHWRRRRMHSKADRSQLSLPHGTRKRK